FGALSFTAITLPTWLFHAFSYTLTLTFTTTSLVVTLLALVVAGYLFVRYRYLNVYSRRSTEEATPNTASQAFDLRPDADNDEDDGQAHYPGEFLSAFLSSIKVFGYLEKPVFHELARHLQTRRLLAGDTMSDLSERERSFYFVVDGCVQVFAKRADTVAGDLDFDAAEGGLRGHTLLNEVRPGGTLSSLFTILSLFTEDVPVRHPGEETDMAAAATDESYGSLDQDERLSAHTSSQSTSPVMTRTTLHSRLADGGESVELFPRMSGSASVTSASMPHSPALPSGSIQEGFAGSAISMCGEQRVESRAAAAIERPDIVFRATVDTTLAVIPAEAFKRVTEKFPNASAHIVQVILTRFQRVTFKTMENYLGLTKELLNIERKLNEMATYDLPADVHRAGGLERLRQQFIGGTRLELPTREVKVAEMSDSGFDSRRFRIKQPRTPFRLDKDSEYIWEQSSKTPRDLSQPPPVHPMSPLRSPVANGDCLLESTQASPRLDGYSRADEHHLRYAAFECIKKSLGILPRDVDAARARTSSRSSSISRDDPIPEAVQVMRSRSRNDSSSGTTMPVGLALSRETSIDETDATSTPTPTPMHAPELRNDVRILFFPKGATLVKQGERNMGLYMVVDGLLDINVDSMNCQSAKGNSAATSTRKTSGHKSTTSNVSVAGGPTSVDALAASGRRQQSLFLIRPGGVVGYLSALTGHASFVNARASTDTFVAYLPRESLERLIERCPTVLLTLAKRLITQLSPLVLHVDFALDWVQVNAGQVLYRQGDDSDSIHVVLNGRLRSISEDDASFKVFREHGQGESIGELEVLTESPRAATLYAIRDSELALLPKTLFNALSFRHPEISLQISRIVALRTRAQQAEPVPRHNPALPDGGQGDFGRSNINLKTITLLPVSADVPVLQFAERLREALISIGASTLLLNHTTVTSVLGRHAFSKLGKLKLMHWLAEQEENYRTILYVADSGAASPWTQRCVRQADCIFLVGLGDGDPAIGQFERMLIGTKSTARKELVLLHNERRCAPGSTRAWLKNRLWVHAHHHVQMPLAKRPGMLESHRRKKTFLNLHLNFQSYLQLSTKKPPTPYTGNRSDFARLARRILGKSVGLVLGGGGARGIAHVGVIRALEESGIPVDMIGGTSIGAFIGGLYARDTDHMAIIGFARMFSSRMISFWRQVLDLTYPITAYFTGHEFNRSLWKCFAETQIEDFWINYYCNTTNITFSRMECHHFGYAWRFIRASMSLSGLMPPVSSGGNLLLDGGYMDNLTVSYMKSLGAETIFAVDVGSVDDTSPVHYGDSLSGVWVFIQRLNPFRSGPAIPSLADIQQRLAYVSSVKQLEEAKVTPGCLYVRPPVEGFGTLEFGNFDTIQAVGYEYGRECLRKWRKQGLL
ncbi:hypothetical protein THASP1DRAFT_10655, partial [Thamnocephalis sphaerospora]